MNNEMRTLVAFLEGAAVPHEVWENPKYGWQVCVPSISNRAGDVIEDEDWGHALSLCGFDQPRFRVLGKITAEEAFWHILEWKHTKAGD